MLVFMPLIKSEIMPEFPCTIIYESSLSEFAPPGQHPPIGGHQDVIAVNVKSCVRSDIASQLTRTFHHRFRILCDASFFCERLTKQESDYLTEEEIAVQIIVKRCTELCPGGTIRKYVSTSRVYVSPLNLPV